MARRPIEFAGFPENLKILAPWSPCRAIIKFWVDGDTCDVLIDGAFNTYPYETIRVAGLDTPELNRSVSREAGQLAREEALRIAPIGTPVVLKTAKDTQTFGRYISSITLPDGSDFAERMKAAGRDVSDADVVKGWPV